MEQRPITLIPAIDEYLRAIEPWFDDPDTIRWLGGREGVRRLPALIQESPGARFGSRRVTTRVVWIAADDETGRLVGLADVETYDDATASLALVVDPKQRGHGLGRAVLREVLGRPALDSVHRLDVVPTDVVHTRAIGGWPPNAV